MISWTGHAVERLRKRGKLEREQVEFKLDALVPERGLTVGEELSVALGRLRFCMLWNGVSWKVLTVLEPGDERIGVRKTRRAVGRKYRSRRDDCDEE